MADKIKISELPEATSLTNLYTLGVDSRNKSVKVPINLLKGNMGKSAYELACEQGFKGTEKEWIESLQGQNGAKGDSAYKAAITGGFYGSEAEFNAALANISNGVQHGNIIITQAEHKVGIFEDEEATQHNIYECAFVLTDLPTTVDATKEYDLCAEPLGFGRYLHVIGLDMVSTDGNTFFQGNYCVERIYISNLRTKGVIRCIRVESGCEKIVLRMRYLKYYGDRIQFSVTLPTGTSPDDVNLSVAPLKYNKRFAFTYTADDTVVGAYSRIWRRINRKWIDDVEFFHMGCVPTTGYIPTNTLCMTDGCGNDRRFGFGVAIWPTLRDEYHPDGRIRDSSTSTTNIYITWEELRAILDFHGSVYFHNMDETKYDKTNPAQVIQGLKEDYDKAFEKLGRRMKVLALPDGLQSYVDAGRIANFVSFMRSSLSYNLIYLNDCGLLRKAETYGGEHTSDITRKLEELETQHAADNPYWVGITSHRVSLEMMGMLETIYERYGKGGDDSIWVASWDEVYEYIAMREGLAFMKNVSGQKVTFEIYVPKGASYYFRDITFLLSGISSTEGVTINTETTSIKGLTFGINNSSMLVNVNFNPSILELAEKYTAKLESSATQEDKDDAVYFVSMLLPDLAAPFTARINTVVIGVPDNLRLNNVTINDGQKSTTERNISISLGVTGTPTYYRVSESPNFTSADWILYASNFIQFVLSSMLGAKTIYVQLKNATVESNVLSASITLEQSTTPTNIVLNSIKINDGAATTNNRNATITVQTNTTPTQYRIGETATLSGVEWIDYTAVMQYMLSAGNGQKSVYVQVKNETSQSEIVMAQITLQESTTPSLLRSIVSLGYDYTSGMASGTSVYDASINATKIRLGNDGVSYSIFDTDGKSVGTVVIAGLKGTSSGYQGHTTGNNTGIYPDLVLQNSAYKTAAIDEAVIEMSLPAGRYCFKVLINITHNVNLINATFTLEHAGTIQTFEMLSSTIDNFTNTMDLNLSVGNAPVYLRMKTNDEKAKVLYINSIEIVQLQ